MDNSICQHHKFGFCKFREQCSKVHVKEKCKNLSACKDLKSCNKRHQRVCKRFVLERFCKFGNECAYLHDNTLNTKEGYEEMVEELKNIKAEVDLLKRTVKSQNYIKEEAKVFQKSINIIKNEILQIKTEMKETAKKLKMMEDEIESESGENEFEEDYDNEDGAEWDLYQIEMVNGDMVWACNLCDHGFDSSVEMKNHMQSKHDRILDIETAGEDRNKHIDLHEDTQEDKNKEDKDDSNHNDGKFTCKLCLERLDGNHESKKHYIKEHKKDINNTKKGEMCDFGFCMDIEEDRCSQFCKYYKDMIDL